MRIFDASRHKVRFGGDIYDWNTEGYVDRKDAKRLDRFSQFAMVAGIDAVNDSGIDFTKEDLFRCGVIVGSGIGGLNEIETQVERLLKKGPDKVSAFTIPKLILNAASAHVSIKTRGEGGSKRLPCSLRPPGDGKIRRKRTRKSEWEPMEGCTNR